MTDYLGQGAFVFMAIAMGKENEDLIICFDRMRKKRNEAIYDIPQNRALGHQSGEAHNSSNTTLKVLPMVHLGDPCGPCQGM